MSAKISTIKSINRIAMAEYMVMPTAINALKAQKIQPGLERFTGTAENFYELWIADFGDKFMKMTSFVRLGSEMEKGFRDYYMERKGYANRLSLQADSAVSKGIFQRLNARDQRNTLQGIFQGELGIDLTADPDFPLYREFMLSRHLYTHQVGVLDEEYVQDWQDLTGEDLRQDTVVVAAGYPMQDIYWFRPLNKFDDYKQACENIINRLP